MGDSTKIQGFLKETMGEKWISIKKWAVFKHGSLTWTLNKKPITAVQNLSRQWRWHQKHLKIQLKEATDQRSASNGWDFYGTCDKKMSKISTNNFDGEQVGVFMRCILYKCKTFPLRYAIIGKFGVKLTVPLEIHSSKLTQLWKMDHLKMCFLPKKGTFHCHASLPRVT